MAASNKNFIMILSSPSKAFNLSEREADLTQSLKIFSRIFQTDNGISFLLSCFFPKKVVSLLGKSSFQVSGWFCSFSKSFRGGRE
jgi:hypothetical protein